MKSHTITLLLALLSAGPAVAQERINVVATLAYLGDVAREVGGDLVEVEVLAPLEQDPHFITATPARAVVLAHADVLIESGMSLELWSERVIDLARNRKIRPGSPGHLFAATGTTALQVPSIQSRAAGDVHPGGNPHVWLDPLNLKRVARNVEGVLKNVRPGDGPTFEKNRKAFEEEIDEAFYGKELLRVLGASLLGKLQVQGKLLGFLATKTFKGKPLKELAGGWLGRALKLEGMTLISYHQVWIYFEAAFGLRIVGTVEDKPGIPPSPGHLRELEAIATANGTKVIVCAPFYPLSRAEGLAQRIGGKAITLPTQPGEQGTTGLRSMFDTIFERLEQARRETQ